MPLPHLWKETFTDLRQWASSGRMHSLLLDFDGTLTPVVPDPDAVFLDATVRRVLQEIQVTGRIAIGIITGRSLEEIRGRVGICGIAHAGNHGMEIAGPSVCYVDSVALDATDAIQSLMTRLKDELNRFHDLQIRNKGLSITIQWSTPHPPDIQKEIRKVVIDTIADGGGRLTVRDAINSVDILPATSWNKSSAATWIKGDASV